VGRVPTDEPSDMGRLVKPSFAPIEVPATHAGSIAVKLLAANRFQVLDKIREPLSMFRLATVGNLAHATEGHLLSVETAGRRAITAAAIAPHGLPTALLNEMDALCRVGGRLMQLSALLRREQVVAHGEFVRLRAKSLEVAADLGRRIDRMQAGLPWELEELLACRQLVQDRRRLGNEASALVKLWLGSERQHAVYSALGGVDDGHGLTELSRARELGATAMTKSRAREVLGLGASASFDAAVEAVVREVDGLAPLLVACASSLDEAPLVRCRDCFDALAVFTRSVPVSRRRRRGSTVSSKPNTTAQP